MLAPCFLKNFSGQKNSVPKRTIFKWDGANRTMGFQSYGDGIVIRGKGIEDVGVSH